MTVVADVRRVILCASRKGRLMDRIDVLRHQLAVAVARHDQVAVILLHQRLERLVRSLRLAA